LLFSSPSPALLTHKKENIIKRYFLLNEEIFEQFIKGEEQLP
jgi:hypothetical protein